MGDTPSEFFEVNGPELPWGDYGNILHHGMTGHLGRDSNGCLQLERVAPFLPSIFFPDTTRDVVVTDQFKRLLSAAPFDDLHFTPVVKKRIVHLDWKSWDPCTQLPQCRPKDGEPENYLLASPHSPLLAENIGLLWEVTVPRSVECILEQTGLQRWQYDLYLLPDTWKGHHLFRPARGVRLFVSRFGKDWFEAHTSGCVSFRPALVK